MDPIDPADEREWEIHRAFEKMKKELAAKDAQLCRAREAMTTSLSALKERMKNQGDPYHHDMLINDLTKALSASGPCAHEEEAKRLREAGPGAMTAIEERIRQKSVEGWTPEHDDQHTRGELSVAAACYALNKMPAYAAYWRDEFREWWPWHPDWDKREKHSRERSLAIAAALCMAEIDRLTELRRAKEGKA